MSQIAQSGARFAVTTGDNAYDVGSQKDYGDLYQVGSATSAVFGPNFWKVPGASLPLFPTSATTITTTPCCSRTGRSTTAASSSGGRYRPRPTAARTARSRPPTRAPGTRSTPGTRVSTSSTPPGTTRTAARPTSTRTTTTTTGRPASDAVPVARERPRHPSARAQVRLLALPDVLRQPGRGLRPVPPGRELARGPAEALQRDARIQRSCALTTSGSPRPPAASRRMRRGRRREPRLDRERGLQPARRVRHRLEQLRRTSEAPAASAPVPTTKDRVHHFLLVNVNGSTVTVTPTDELGRTFDSGHVHGAAQQRRPVAHQDRLARPGARRPAADLHATVSNAGPSTAIGTQLTDTLPAGVTFDSATPSQGTCSQSAGVVSCALGTLALRRERDGPDQGQAAERGLDHQPGERQLERQRLRTPPTTRRAPRRP